MIAPAELLGWVTQATVKGSLMIVLVAAIHLLIGKRVDARWRHLLWIVVLVRLAVPFGPASPLSVFNLLPNRVELATPMPVQHFRLTAPRTLPPVTVQMIRIATPALPTYLKWLIGGWLAGVVLFAMRIAIGTWRTRRAVALALRAEPNAHLESALRGCLAQLGIARRVRIVECSAVRTPALHGVIRPVLLLPPGLVCSFRAEELRYVILHELWHLRRLDVAVSWILSAVQTLHWFNPLVWFAASRIKEEREVACDELTLSCLEEDERFGYGRTILKLLDSFRAAAPIPALVGIVNARHKMKRRITMIASFQNRTRFSLLFLMIVVAVGFAGLTDAQNVQHQFIRTLAPGANSSTIGKLDQRVTFELTNASFGELLNVISNKTGLNVAQAPELATLAVQQAKFSVKVDNVPAHAVLLEALMPFHLMPEPSASGVTITPCAALEGAQRNRTERIETAPDGTKRITEEQVVVMVGPKNGDAAAKELAPIQIQTNGTHIDHQMMIHANGAMGECKFDASGKLHRELTINTEEDGVKSEGKLSIDITK
jgi:bla regulator protein BlaR1